MKCIIGFLLLAICAFQMISAWPVRSRSGGMVFYQPDYYNAHRAFVMQYASQPVKSYRRQGQAAGVSAYASGKKITTGTFLNQNNYEKEDDEEEFPPSVSQAVAHAPSHDEEEQEHHEEEEIDQPQQDTFVPAELPAAAHDVPEDNLEVPVVLATVPQNKKKKTQHDEEEEDDEEEEQAPARSKPRKNAGATYFPVSFGTAGGAIAIANSYSTGKGGTASSRATAYGSPSKSKSKKRNE